MTDEQVVLVYRQACLRLGANEVAKIVGLNVATIVRLSAGLPVQKATAILAATQVKKLVEAQK